MGRRLAERGWLEGERLSLLRERRPHFGERGAAARGEHELGGLVGDDAPVRGDVEALRLGDAPQEVLGAAAGDRERSAVIGGGPDPRGQGFGQVGVHRSRVCRRSRLTAVRRRDHDRMRPRMRIIAEAESGEGPGMASDSEAGGSRLDPLSWLRGLARCLEKTTCEHCGRPVPLEAGLRTLVRLWARQRADGAGVYWIGNGGSAATASHLSQDLLNKCGIRSLTFNDPALIHLHGQRLRVPGRVRPAAGRPRAGRDVLMAVSSSGMSDKHRRRGRGGARQGAGGSRSLRLPRRQPPARTGGDAVVPHSDGQLRPGGAGPWGVAARGAGLPRRRWAVLNRGHRKGSRPAACAGNPPSWIKVRTLSPPLPPESPPRPALGRLERVAAHCRAGPDRSAREVDPDNWTVR